MKITRFFPACAVVVLLGGMSTAALTAQEAPPDPTPKEPLIPRAPDISAWTITYRYKQSNPETKPTPGSNAKPPEQIVSMQVQKTGKTYHRVTSWSSGAESDSWTIGQRQLVKNKSATTFSLLPTEGPLTDDYSHSDFEDLAWITMKYYAGFKKGDQPVFVFQAKNAERPMTRRDKYNLAFLSTVPAASTVPKLSRSLPGATPATLDKQAMLAQIYGDTSATVVLDATTQYPVAYDDGKTIWAYKFTTAPTEPLVPPPEVTKILQRYSDYVKGTTIHPSAP